MFLDTWFQLGELFTKLGSVGWCPRFDSSSKLLPLVKAGLAPWQCDLFKILVWTTLAALKRNLCMYIKRQSAESIATALGCYVQQLL